MYCQLAYLPATHPSGRKGKKLVACRGFSQSRGLDTITVKRKHFAFLILWWNVPDTCFCFHGFWLKCLFKCSVFSFVLQPESEVSTTAEDCSSEVRYISFPFKFNDDFKDLSLHHVYFNVACLWCLSESASGCFTVEFGWHQWFINSFPDYYFFFSYYFCLVLLTYRLLGSLSAHPSFCLERRWDTGRKSYNLTLMYCLMLLHTIC